MLRVAPEKATYDVRRLAAATVGDASQPAVGRRLKEVVGKDRSHVERTADPVGIVTGQQDNLPRLHFDRRIVLHLEHKSPCDEVMVGDDLRWLARNGRQSSGPTFAVTHHGAVNSASRKTPPVNLTTRSTSDNASMGGQFVSFPAGRANDPAARSFCRCSPSANLASPLRASIKTLNPKGRRRTTRAGRLTDDDKRQPRPFFDWRHGSKRRAL